MENNVNTNITPTVVPDITAPASIQGTTTEKRKTDFVMIIVVLLFLIALFTFIFILTRPSASSTKNNGTPNNTTNGSSDDSDDNASLIDPFSLPRVEDSKVVDANDNLVVYEVKGKVIEFMADFLLRIADSGEWIVVQESEIPGALDYQEIIIQKGNEEKLSVVAETLTEESVRVTVVPTFN